VEIKIPISKSKFLSVKNLFSYVVLSICSSSFLYPLHSDTLEWRKTAFLQSDKSVYSRKRPIRLPREPAVSITLSPLHFALPLLELTGEFNIDRRIGMALIGGYGSVVSESNNQRFKRTLPVYEIGGQLRYYLAGSFSHGMQIGAEILWSDVRDVSAINNLHATTSGVALGPFVGYKFISRFGFTLDTQFGFQHINIKAKDPQSYNDVSAEDKRIMALLNINIGWSF
jgi:hypothetical protein